MVTLILTKKHAIPSPKQQLGYAPLGRPERCALLPVLLLPLDALIARPTRYRRRRSWDCRRRCCRRASVTGRRRSSDSDNSWCWHRCNRRLWRGGRRSQGCFRGFRDDGTQLMVSSSALMAGVQLPLTPTASGRRGETHLPTGRNAKITCRTHAQQHTRQYSRLFCTPHESEVALWLEPPDAVRTEALNWLVAT